MTDPGSPASSRPSPSTERLRVLVIVGTDVHPFTRLVEWTDAWAGRQAEAVECFVQYGHSGPPGHADGADFLEHDTLEKLLDEADIVVCHGGPSTISEARRRGFRPIVVPRWKQFGEHVDNHQRLFVERLARDRLVWNVSTRPEFVDLLDRAVADRSIVRLAPGDRSNVEASVRRFAELVAGLFDGRRR